MELLSKHLSIYLDHALKVRPKFRQGEIWLMNGVVGDSIKCKQSGTLRHVRNFIPQLRPLDLDKEIVFDGKRFTPRAELEKLAGGNLWSRLPKDLITKDMPYWMVYLLCKWHFDVWGLLNEKLAEAI